MRSQSTIGVGIIIGLLIGVHSVTAQAPGRAELVETNPSKDRPRSALDLVEEERENPFDDPIETDRDSFTPSVRTVAQNRFILEAAYSFADQRRVAETHSFPEFLLRYGLMQRVELRLGWNYEVGGAGNTTSGTTEAEFETTSRLEREHTINYGVKIFLAEQDDWLPESSVILTGRTPTGGPDTETHFVGTWIIGWELPRRSKLDAAIRYATANEKEDRFGVWAPSAVIKAPIGDRWNVHLEYFGEFSTGKGEEFRRHFISPGVHFLITPNVEVGVRLGWGLNDQSSRFFANTGLGWRF